MLMASLWYKVKLKMLKNYKVPTQEIALAGDQTMTVRGLSLSDILALVRSFRAELESIFTAIAAGGHDGLDASDTAQLAFAAIQSAPDMVAHGIALAANEPDAADVVATLPLDVQVAALEAVANLTFATGGGPKKLLETVVRLMQNTRQTVDSLTSPTGSGDSADK